MRERMGGRGKMREKEQASEQEVEDDGENPETIARSCKSSATALVRSHAALRHVHLGLFGTYTHFDCFQQSANRMSAES